mgnify:CR=1 FL=1
MWDQVVNAYLPGKHARRATARIVDSPMSLASKPRMVVLTLVTGGIGYLIETTRECLRFGMPKLVFFEKIFQGDDDLPADRTDEGDESTENDRQFPQQSDDDEPEQLM